MADIKKAAAAAKPVAKAVAATKPAEAKVEEKKVEAKKAVEEKNFRTGIITFSLQMELCVIIMTVWYF